MLSLMPDEAVLTQLPNDLAFLTTHRIYFEQKGWGRTIEQSIMLEHIAWCKFHKTSNVLLLVLATAGLVCGIFGALNEHDQVLGPSILITLILIYVYLLSRRSFLIIGTGGSEIRLPVNGFRKQDIAAFIKVTEKAKANRLARLAEEAEII